MFSALPGHQQAVPASGESRGHTGQERGAPLLRDANPAPDVPGRNGSTFGAPRALVSLGVRWLMRWTMSSYIEVAASR